MKPYDNNFILDKINKYSAKIKEQKVNNISVIKKKSISNEGYMYREENNLSMDEILLLDNDKCVMKINKSEIQALYSVCKSAHGKVGIVGLGLGYSVQEMLMNKKVESITVYEVNKDIIEIYKNNFGIDPRVTILNKDAFKAKPEKFDTFLCDIYNYELTDKVVEDYKKLNELHEIEDYYFYNLEHFMLSCSYNDLLWVYIPENWVESSKEMYEALDMSGILKNYYRLDEDKVKDILMKFKEILND